MSYSYEFSGIIRSMGMAAEFANSCYVGPLEGLGREDMLGAARVLAGLNSSLRGYMLQRGIGIPKGTFSLGDIVHFDETSDGGASEDESDDPFSRDDADSFDCGIEGFLCTVDEWNVEMDKRKLYLRAIRAHKTYVENLKVATKVGRLLACMSKEKGASDSRINGLILAFLPREEILGFGGILIKLLMNGIYVRNLDISAEPFCGIIIAYIKEDAHTVKEAIAMVRYMHPLYREKFLKKMAAARPLE